MTETAALVRRLELPRTRARAAAVLLVTGGFASGIAAAGMALAPRVAAIVISWLALVVVMGVAAGILVRIARRGAVAAPVLARLLEKVAEARAGSIAGLVTPAVRVGGVSPALLSEADARAARLVERAAPAARRMLVRASRRELVAGLAAAVVGAGAALAVAGSPAALGGGGRGERGAAFWHPLRTLRDARAPVRLVLDRATVRRGDSVTATIEVPGGLRAVLWTRGPGEAWRPQALALDSAGRATRRLGPLYADLFVRAASGGRESAERKVSVALPNFVVELALTASYPAYLELAEEPLVSGPDTVLVPAGTAILTRGLASVALDRAAWIGEGKGEGGRGMGRGERLHVAGARFDGRLVPPASGTWRLMLAPADGTPLEDPAPVLHLRVVPDSAPVVAVPVPGRDTTLPLSLRQPLVIDVRDDHGVRGVSVVSWRVSRTGKVGAAVAESLDVSGVGERAIVQGELDLQRRGLLPGDTVRFRVEAWDNVRPPPPRLGRSAEFALRLPSMEELRAATRAAARDVAAAADSLAAAQRDLGERTGDLAHQRSRDGERRPAVAGGEERSPEAPLGFQAEQRAGAIAREQAALGERVAELARAVEEIARAAQAAGIDDSAFHARLREVQALLERALTPELEARLRELEQALARLDPDATRDALARLAQAQAELRDALERSEHLFRRAAVEGALASLAADAEDLQRRQAEWAREQAPRADSGAAATERALGERTDSLARGIEQAARDLARTAERGEGEGRQELGGDAQPDTAAPLGEPLAAARRAGTAMQRAAGAAERGDARAAGRSGTEAAQALDQVPRALRGRRDSLAGAWRAEALAALDRALSETAALAERQEQVARALRRGEAGVGTRGRLGAVAEGTAAVERQIREASGKHALVSPRLEAALGFAQRQMREAREQLAQGNPNVAAAADLAEQASDALNVTAHLLARSRNAVEGAESGTGFAEAVEQLARLAQGQRGLAGQAQALLPLVAAGAGRQAVLEQLRALAGGQRALAEQLERLQAQGASAAAGALAQEARELARALEAGRLDRQTIARQERLFRRLLDAGRTLSGSEPDPEKERVSRSATGDSARLPALLAPGATGAGPRVRYPTWEELSGLTPEQRRLVLEYFRRLNAPR